MTHEDILLLIILGTLILIIALFPFPFNKIIYFIRYYSATKNPNTTDVLITAGEFEKFYQLNTWRWNPNNECFDKLSWLNFKYAVLWYSTGEYTNIKVRPKTYKDFVDINKYLNELQRKKERMCQIDNTHTFLTTVLKDVENMQKQSQQEIHVGANELNRIINKMDLT